MPVAHHWEMALRPEVADRRLRKNVFDDDLAPYLRMLLICAAAAALFQIISAVGFAVYSGLNTGSTIDWWTLTNVSATFGVGAFFLVLFLGTVALFVAALILHLTIKRKLIDVMHALILAATPFVLFAWIPILAPGVAIWTGVLAVRHLRARSSRKEVLARE